MHVADCEHAYGAENTLYASAEHKQSGNLLCRVMIIQHVQDAESMQLVMTNS